MTPPAEVPFSPRNFLRARRPEAFSDSTVEERAALDRGLLEYHLDTLTSRSQEAQFEEFARQLLQREVCPNLLPHTGPSGGGDSKVDAETYPVSESLTATWYVGVGGAAGSERWAFAFSAKQDWSSKVQSDVKKIADAGRGYTKAFFVTSRYVADKKRAAMEDSLRARHAMDVRIFDRTWILDRVFQGNHEAIAISCLSIAVTPPRQHRRGPLDVRRQQELDELENKIANAAQSPVKLPFVDDCIQAAVLSRNLELPRTQIDGRFERAWRAADQHGTLHQQVLATYQRAWTEFWWHEDFRAFLNTYEQVERLATTSSNASDVELLSNLWTLLAGATSRGQIDRQQADFDSRTEQLRCLAQRVADDSARPSSSLQARTCLTLVRLFTEGRSDPAPALLELHRIVEDAEGLIGFRLNGIADLVAEMSPPVSEAREYELLFEKVVEETARRKGEIAGARMLLKRGAEQLDTNRPYDAIRNLGRALRSLYRHESRHEMVRALYLCGAAYERAGLLWAARGAVMHAASIAANEWWSHSEINLAQAACYNRIKWIELQLGRLPHVLAWHQLDATVREVLRSEGYSAERLSIGDTDFNALLAILLLRCDVWQLKQLRRLPDRLDAIGLPGGSLALLFALGHTSEARDSGVPVSSDDEVQDCFGRLADQPAGAELPAPDLLTTRVVEFRSVVLGCRINVSVDNVSPCIEVAESYLAAIEALLSTSVAEGVMPLAAKVEVRVRRSDFAEGMFTHRIRDDDGLLAIEVSCARFVPSGMPADEQAKVKDAMLDLVTATLSNAFFVDRGQLERVIVEERALQRALDFTGTFGTIANTVGIEPLQMSHWLQSSSREYPLLREAEWDFDRRRSSTAEAPVDVRPGEDLKAGVGDIPPELANIESVKHTELGFESVIRGPLWDRASWRAVGYAVAQGMPPWMILGFENSEPAGQIFTHWVKELGTDDAKNRLRVSIVRGVSKRKPHHYRVVIGSNVNAATAGKFFSMMMRVQEMEPESDLNLSRFLSAYALTGIFYLGVCGVRLDRPSEFPEPMRHAWLVKRSLYVKFAWEVGRHDMESAGVGPEDDVWIPPGRENDAPVLELLRWRREAEASRRPSSRGRSSVAGHRRKGRRRGR